MQVRFALAAAALLGGCSSSSPGGPQDDAVIRLSTTIGLESIGPDVQAGMTRTLMDLVYDVGELHVERVEAEGGHFRLVVRRDSRLSPKVLAETLRLGTLASVEVDGRDLRIATTDGRPPTLRQIFFEVGPYQQASFAPDKLVLRRRGGEGLQRIEVYKFETQDEEWRRFLAREVDLSLFLTPGTLTYLRDVPSVRVVPVEQSPEVALHFRTDSPVFADREMRRYVAARVRRPAIAQIAVGDRTVALPPPSADGRAEPSGQRIRLLALSNQWDHQQAALVLEQQLIEMGFTVSLVSASIDEMTEALRTRDYDAFVFFTGLAQLTRHTAERYMSDHAANIPRYRSEAYDAAVTAGNLDEARALLAADIPFTALYRSIEAVAIDRRFCGVHPQVNYDLSWLADVHLCAPGEAQ